MAFEFWAAVMIHNVLSSFFHLSTVRISLNRNIFEAKGLPVNLVQV